MRCPLGMKFTITTENKIEIVGQGVPCPETSTFYPLEQWDWLTTCPIEPIQLKGAFTLVGESEPTLSGLVFIQAEALSLR